MGNTQLKIYEEVLCEVRIDNERVRHLLSVLPDSDLSLPMLIGRDLLKKFNIFLCKLKLKKYSIKELMQIKNQGKCSHLEF